MTTQHEEKSMNQNPPSNPEAYDRWQEDEQDRLQREHDAKEAQRKADLGLVRQMLSAAYEPHEYEEVMKRLEA